MLICLEARRIVVRRLLLCELSILGEGGRIHCSHGYSLIGEVQTGPEGLAGVSQGINNYQL